MLTIIKKKTYQTFLSHLVTVSSGCIEWNGIIKKDSGYGVFTLKKKQWRAHRLAYELFIGQIPKTIIEDGIEKEAVIDHICRNRKCVNTDHLRILSRGKNVSIGEAGKYKRHKNGLNFCVNGHEYTEDNTIYQNKELKKYKICKICRDQKNKERITKLTEQRHLEGRIHSKFRTHCPKGHSYNDENTYINPKTRGRTCRNCQKEYRASYKQKDKSIDLRIKTHCKEGHELLTSPSGRKYCNVCRRIDYNKIKHK